MTPAAPRGRVAFIALVVLATLASANPADAQRAGRTGAARPEVRVDYLDPETVHLGVGLNVPAGTYARFALVAAGGAGWRGGHTGASARVDAIGRFTFDPFRERRWGLSAGGGVSVRYDEALAADRWRALIAVLIDLEGPRVGGTAPALQIGLGGGWRAGVILRGAAPDRR